MKGKTEIAKSVAAGAGITVQAAGKAVDTVFDTIKALVAAGEIVTVKGFGTFKTVDVAEKQGRNPKTGETVTIPAHRAVKFKPSADFKGTVK